MTREKMTRNPARIARGNHNHLGRDGSSRGVRTHINIPCRSEEEEEFDEVCYMHSITSLEDNPYKYGRPAARVFAAMRDVPLTPKNSFTCKCGKHFHIQCRDALDEHLDASGVRNPEYPCCDDTASEEESTASGSDEN